MSIPQLAKSAGVTQRLLRHLEADTPIDGASDEISVKTLSALAGAVGLPVTALLEQGGSNEPEPLQNAGADIPLIANILMRVARPVDQGQIAAALG